MRKHSHKYTWRQHVYTSELSYECWMHSDRVKAYPLPCVPSPSYPPTSIQYEARFKLIHVFLSVITSLPHLHVPCVYVYRYGLVNTRRLIVASSTTTHRRRRNGCERVEVWHSQDSPTFWVGDDIIRHHRHTHLQTISTHAIVQVRPHPVSTGCIIHSMVLSTDSYILCKQLSKSYDFPLCVIHFCHGAVYCFARFLASQWQTGLNSIRNINWVVETPIVSTLLARYSQKVIIGRREMSVDNSIKTCLALHLRDCMRTKLILLWCVGYCT